MLQPDMHDSENGTHSANGAETLVLTANNLVYPEPSSTYYDVININQHHSYHHFHHNHNQHQHLHHNHNNNNNNHYHNHQIQYQTSDVDGSHQYNDTTTIPTTDIVGTINTTTNTITTSIDDATKPTTSTATITSSNITTQKNDVIVEQINNQSNNNDLSLLSNNNNQNNLAQAAATIDNSNITTAIGYQSTQQEQQNPSDLKLESNLSKQQSNQFNNNHLNSQNNIIDINNKIENENGAKTFQGKIVSNNVSTLSTNDDDKHRPINILSEDNHLIDDIMIDSINDEPTNGHTIGADENNISPPSRNLDTIIKNNSVNNNNIKLDHDDENALIVKNLSSNNICNIELNNIDSTSVDANITSSIVQTESSRIEKQSHSEVTENHLVYLSPSSTTSSAKLKVDINYDATKIDVDCTPPINTYDQHITTDIEFSNDALVDQENRNIIEDEDEEFDEEDNDDEDGDDEEEADEEEEEDDDEEEEDDDDDDDDDDEEEEYEDDDEIDDDDEQDNEDIVDPGQHCQQQVNLNDDFNKHDTLTNANDVLDGERMLEVTRKLVRNTERDPDRDLRKQVLLKTAIKKLPHFMEYNRYNDSLDRSFHHNNMSPQVYYEHHHHDPQQKLYNSVQPNAIQMSTTGLRMLDLNDDHDIELTSIDHSDPNLVYSNNNNNNNYVNHRTSSPEQHDLYISQQQHQYDRYHQRTHELNHYEPTNGPPLIRHNSLDNLYQPINASDINEEIKDSGAGGDERIPIAFQIACEIYDFTCAPDDNERKLLDNLTNGYYIKPTKESKTNNPSSNHKIDDEKDDEDKDVVDGVTDNKDSEGSDTSSSSHSSTSTASDESANSIDSSKLNESDEANGISLLEASLNTTGDFYHTSHDSGVALFTNNNNDIIKSSNKRSSSSIGLDDEMDIEHLTELSSSRGNSFGSNNQYKKLRKREIIE